MDGIDISMWQAGIDLSAVPADFIICKATEGNGYTDPEFARFAKEIKRLKRARGFYHFARADLNTGTAGAKREAAWFAKTVAPHLDGETLLVLDWEAGSVSHGPSWAKVWLDHVHQATGIRPLVYTSTSVVSGWDWSKIAPNHPLWLANYGTNPVRNGYLKTPTIPKLRHWSKPALYQYGSRGRLPGWGGDLDFNKAYIDRAEWIRLAGGAKEDPVVVGMVSPVEGWVSSEFSPTRRNPVTGIVESHAGIDIAAPMNTPVRAAYAGTVVGVGAGLLPGRSGDRNVLIQNPDGERQYYGHLEKAVVKVGQKVKAGDLIGHVGQRGNATGPHLHFEIHNAAGTPRDPRLDFNFHGVAPGSKPTIGDWFTMASKKDLEDVIWGVLSSHNINISGTTKRALGVDKRSTFALLRYAAAALFEGREQHADLVAQNRALTAAVETLATSQGLDPVDVTNTINKAVSAALADLEVTLSVSKDEDLED